MHIRMPPRRARSPPRDNDDRNNDRDDRQDRQRQRTAENGDLVDLVKQLVQTVQQQNELLHRTAPEPVQPARNNDNNQHERMLDRFLRFQPPRFFGEPDDRKAENWVAVLEKIFRVLQCGEGEKVEFAIFLMEGAACAWWRMVELKWAEEGTERVWTNFKVEFMRKFIPQVVKDAREKEFMSLVQAGSNVAQYEANFIRLLPYAAHIMADERRKVQRFIQGLRPELQWAMMAMDCEGYAKVVEKALAVEA